MGNLGFSELALIAVIGLLVLGPKKLPEVAKGLGEAFRAFQDALRGVHTDGKRPPEDEEPGDRPRPDSRPESSDPP